MICRGFPRRAGCPRTSLPSEVEFSCAGQARTPSHSSLGPEKPHALTARRSRTPGGLDEVQIVLREYDAQAPSTAFRLTLLPPAFPEHPGIEPEFSEPGRRYADVRGRKRDMVECSEHGASPVAKECPAGCTTSNLVEHAAALKHSSLRTASRVAWTERVKSPEKAQDSHSSPVYRPRPGPLGLA
jgi:hypothetical protein